MIYVNRETFPWSSFHAFIKKDLQAYYDNLFYETELKYINKCVDILNKHDKFIHNAITIPLTLTGNYVTIHLYNITTANMFSYKEHFSIADECYEELREVAKEYYKYKKEKKLIYDWMVLNEDNLPSCITGIQSNFDKSKFNIENLIYIYLVQGLLPL